MSNFPVPICNPDGSFKLRRSSGEPILGNYNDPTFPTPICHSPEIWYIDCNCDGPPGTIRIYRFAEDSSPTDIHLYSYNPQLAKWKTARPKRGRGQQRNRRTGLPNLSLRSFLTKPIVLLSRALRWLLGDYEQWPAYGKYEKVRVLDLGAGGIENFGNPHFYPTILLYSGGDIVIEDEAYSKTWKIKKMTADERFRFVRKRGSFQKLYILKKDAEGLYLPDAVLNYEYGQWWVWKKVGPGSLSDAWPIIGVHAATFFYLLGLLYMLLLLYQ